MLRTHYPLILAVMIAISCISVAAPRNIVDIKPQVAQEHVDVDVDIERVAEVAPAALADKLLELEKKQNEVLAQQELISRRLDAIIDHVEEIDNGY
jgi:hypothetical protein